MEKQTPQKFVVEISVKTFVIALLLLASVYLLITLRDVLVGLFISILAATALNPLINRLELLKISRTLAVLIVYLSIISIISLFVALVLPPLITQTEHLINSLPINGLASALRPIEVNLENLQLITNQLGSFLPLLRFVSSTFSGIITFFTFAVITFYILVDRKKLPKFIAQTFKNKTTEDHVQNMIAKIETQLGSWVRGQVTLMIVVGVVTYIGLLLLGVPYALPLAIIAGLLEIIPNIGPTLSAIPAIAVPLLVEQDPLTALFVVALYVIIQQVENNVLVPKIMQSAVGIHPLVTILLIIIGLKLSGVAGAILAVPLFLVGKVFYNQLLSPYLQNHSLLS